MDIESIYIMLIVPIIMSVWGIGALINEYLRRKKIYGVLSTQRFIKNKKWNEWLGIYFFKALVTKTIYARINISMNVKSYGIEELERIRKIMIDSEIGHSIAFLISEFVFIYLSYSIGLEFLVIGTILNIFLNVYPSLLQQINKCRINDIIKKYSC